MPEKAPSDQALLIGRRIRSLLLDDKVIYNPKVPLVKEPLADTATTIARWVAMQRSDWLNTKLGEVPEDEIVNQVEHSLTNTESRDTATKSIVLGEPSAKSGISAFLGGRRSPSDELRQAVVNFAEFRLEATDIVERERILADIENAFDLLERHLDEEERLLTLGLTPRFQKLVSAAKEWFAVLPGYFPVGIGGTLDRDNAPTRKRTTEYFLNKVRALDDPSIEVDYRGIYCFTSRPLAEKFWFNVLYMLVAGEVKENAPKLSMENAISIVQHNEKKDRIRTYILNSPNAVLPFVLFDPKNDEFAGYQVFHVKGLVENWPLPKIYLGPLKKFYLDVVDNRVEGLATRVTFKELKDKAMARVDSVVETADWNY